MPALLDAPPTAPAAPTASRWVDGVTVPSHVLGPVCVREADRFYFPAGLYGFAEARHWALVPSGHPAFCWMQSTVEPSLAFLLADPFAAFADYAPEVPDAELVQLGEGLAPAPGRVAVFAVVTLGSDGSASANLRAPLVLDTHTRRGRQVVLPAEARGVAEPIALG